MMVVQPAQPSSAGDDRWEINNELGINCSSEGPGGNSHGSSAAALLWQEPCLGFFCALQHQLWGWAGEAAHWALTLPRGSWQGLASVLPLQ